MNEKINSISVEIPQEQSVTPEGSDIGLELEKNLEQAISEIETAQNEIIANIDQRIENISVSSGLSKQKAESIFTSGGFAECIKSAKERIAILVEDTKEKILDYKINRLVDQCRWGNGGRINFGVTKLRDLVATLTIDQLRKHPDIINEAKARFLNVIKTESEKHYHDSSGWFIRDTHSIVDLFKAQPEISNEFLTDPEVQLLQEKIFLKCLVDPGHQQDAVALGNSLYIDTLRSRDLVINALKDTLTRSYDTNIHDYIYNTRRAIEDFGIDKNTVLDLAFQSIQKKLKGSYPFEVFSGLEYNFGLSAEDISVLVETHREELEELKYVAYSNLLKTTGAFDLDDYLSHDKKENNRVDANREGFKKYLERNPQVIKDIVLTQITNGIILNGKAEYNLESFFPVHGILASEEAKETAYIGVQNMISKRIPFSEIQYFTNRFNLDIEKIKSDPQTLENVRGSIEHYLKAGIPFWPQELLSFLDIKKEQIQDLLVSCISSQLKQGDMGVLRLIDGLSLDDNDKVSISKEVFGTEDRFNYVLAVKKLMTGQFAPKLFGLFMKEHERFLNKTTEQLQAYVDISQKIIDSPSQEIQRLKDQLLVQLLETDNPVVDYQKIESIFIKNNIPTVGKVYGVFETLHNPKNLEQKIRQNTSPVLQQASTRKRYYTIYQDMLKIHIESGNRSMKEYAEILQSGGKLIDQHEQQGLESLNPHQQEELRYCVGKLETLQAKSALDTADDAFQVVDVADLSERIKHVREGLKVPEGQTILERVSDMYLRPVGLKSLDELLEKMKKAKNSTDERSRQIVNGARSSLNTGEAILEISSGDFLKGVDFQYISNILQNGSVAKEFLGANSDSDATPLDTDISLVKPEDAEGGFANSIKESIANNYGELLFVLKDRGQYQLTTIGQPAKVEAGKMELFKTGVAGERHYGIRTGFPTTEIDFMIAKEDVLSKPEWLKKLYFEIAQNGYYLPVTDTSGKVIFTPEIYDEYRKSFAGLEKFDAPPLDFHPTTESEHSYRRMSEITTAIPEDSERVNQSTQVIRGEIKQTLGGLGVGLRPEFDTSILGAEFLDTGSTGRHTNTPGDFDFDFSLKLDAKDFSRATQIAESIKKTMTFAEDNSHQEADGYYQLRVKGVTSIGGKQFEKPLDIDIGFASKSDLSVYGSHDAIRDRLNNIKKNNGQDAYDQTIANVILTKQILKEGHAYKKQEDGGFGGVGVENWILANGGNMEEAFRNFRSAAYENGQRLPYERFRDKYKILDPGMNIKFQNHDNFIAVLKPAGYEAMLNTIDNYLNQ